MACTRGSYRCMRECVGEACRVRGVEEETYLDGAPKPESFFHRECLRCLVGGSLVVALIRFASKMTIVNRKVCQGGNTSVLIVFRVVVAARAGRRGGRRHVGRKVPGDGHWNFALFEGRASEGARFEREFVERDEGVVLGIVR